MTYYRISLTLFLGLVIVFVASLFVSIPWLPERMATHFDVAGRPNAWMSRAQHLCLMGATGLCLPTLIIGLFRTAKYVNLPINIPHGEYWLTNERRSETVDDLYHHAIWLSSLLLGFFTALHWLVVLSNRIEPPRLSTTGIGVVAGVFLSGTVVWVVILLRRFSAVPIAAPLSESPGC
jgi:uncharacterized membrane protein